jgi:TatA/E family protein of Tat protein translocase
LNYFIGYPSENNTNELTHFTPPPSPPSQGGGLGRGFSNSGGNMFGLGLQELLIILVIFLLIFGVKRLPDIGEGLGKTLKELRKIRGERKEEKEKKEEGEEDLISGLKKQVEEMPGMKEAKEFKEAADKVKKITKILK